LNVCKCRCIASTITETPFDISPVFPIKPDDLKLEKVLEVIFMAQFG